MQELFYQIFNNMPRLGPGSREATLKAISKIEIPKKNLAILDIGCGTGAQTMVLAQNLSGKIIAVDNYQPFLDEIRVKTKEVNLKSEIKCMCRDMNELDFEKDTFDLVWSEGAIYIMGFKKGLEMVARFIRPGGYVVFSDMNYLKPNPPKEVADFFLAECPWMLSVEENIGLIEESGYTLVDHFPLDRDDHWTPYYAPLQERVNLFRKQYAGDPEAMEIIEGLQYEIDLFEKYGHWYGYVFYVMGRREMRKENYF